MRIFVGIDNGLDGAICAVDEGSRILLKKRMPVLKVGKGKVVDVIMLKTLLLAFPREKTVVLLEEASKQSLGTLSLCSTWFTYGHIQCLLKIREYRFETETPRNWQKTFWKTPKMPKGKKFDTKAAALLAATRLWPNESWLASARCFKPHDGIVDAVLIAEYARRQNL